MALRNNLAVNPETVSEITNTGSIYVALEYLARETSKLGLDLTAHFIGCAAASMKDNPQNTKGTTH